MDQKLHYIKFLSLQRFLYILLLLLSLSTYSQSVDSIVYRKFDLGFTYSPDYCNRKLKSNDASNWMLYMYDTMEVSKYGYTLGLNITFKIKEYLYFSTGLLFADKGERTKPYPIQPVNNYINHYYYLDLPFKINYYLHHQKYYNSKTKKVKMYLCGGGAFSLFLNSRVTTETGNAGTVETINNHANLSPLNLTFIAGFGIDCPITKQWYFKFEPIYRTSVTSISNTPIKKYLYSLGINVGLFCKF